jgi:hypothetical protein
MLLFIAAWAILVTATATDAPTSPAAQPGIGNFSSTGTAEQSRRKLQGGSIARYQFGISISLNCPVHGRPWTDECNESYWIAEGSDGLRYQQCDYCRDAIIGLRTFWTHVNTEQTKFYMNQQDGSPKIIIDRTILYDEGDKDTMLYNYELMCQQHGTIQDGDTEKGPLLFLFGPANPAWNDAAATIAQKYNKTMILWAFEYGTYKTKPGPEQPSTYSYWQKMSKESEAFNKAVFGRKLESETPEAPGGIEAYTSDEDDTCDPLVTDHCFMPSRQEKTGEVIPGKSDVHVVDEVWTPQFQRSPPSDTTASDDVFGRTPRRFLSQRGATFKNHGLCDAGKQYPCPNNMLWPYEVYLNCTPAVKPVLEATTSRVRHTSGNPVKIMRVPAGTSKFSFSAVVASASFYAANPNSIEIEVLSGVDNTCVAGLNNIRDSRCKHTVYCLSDDQGKPIFCKDHNGMKFALFRSLADTYTIAFQDTLTEDIVLQAYLVSEDVPEIELAMAYSYDDVTCFYSPSDLCRNCSTDLCSIDGQFPVCDGSHTYECSYRHWPDGRQFVFDMNTELKYWAEQSIRDIHAAGARKLAFVYFDSATFGGDTPGLQCCHLAQFGADLPGADVTLYRIDISSTFMEDMRTLRQLEVEVFIHCGQLANMVYFAMGAKAFNLNAKAFLTDRPFGYELISATKAFNVNWFMEPMAMHYNRSKECSVFDSFNGAVQKLTSAYTKLNFDKRDAEKKMNYASLQTMAVGAIMVQTIKAMTKQDLEEQSKIAAYLKTAKIETFFADFNFSDIGQQKASDCSTRQYWPVKIANFPGSDEVVRYESSEIKVVSSPPIALPGHGNMWYDIPDWIQKELQVYPCAAGCVFHSQMCVPCEKGTYRNIADIDCRPCAPNHYANVKGMRRCLKCPSGAICSAIDLPPAENFFAVVRIGNQSDDIDSNFSAMPNRFCVDPSRLLTQTTYEACRPITICKGGVQTCVGTNMGMLCGQCGSRQTYQGMFQGKRECSECLSKNVIYILSVLVAFAFILITKTIADRAFKAAHEASDSSCALLRTLVHYLHTLAIVKEACRLDVSTLIAITSLPLDLLIRPFELIQIHCTDGGDDPKMAVSSILQASLICFPLFIGIIALYHFLQGIIGYIGVALRCAEHFFSRIRTTGVKSVRPARQFVSHNIVSHQTSVTKQEATIAEPVGRARASATEPSGVVTKLASTDTNSASVGAKPTIAMEERTSADSKEKKRRRHVDFSRIVGPGAQFASMHEGFALQEHLRTFGREILVSAILLYPICCRGLCQMFTCVEIKGVPADPLVPQLNSKRRLLINLDIICDSPKHEDLIGNASVYFYIILFGVPALIALLMLFLRREVFDLEYRRITQILLDGFKPDKIQWEVFLNLRTGLLIFCTKMDALSDRCLVMLMIIVACICLHIEIRPYDFKDRQILHFFDLFGARGSGLSIRLQFVPRFVQF